MLRQWNRLSIPAMVLLSRALCRPIAACPRYYTMTDIHRTDRVVPSLLHLVAGNGARVLLRMGTLFLIARATINNPAIMDTFVHYLAIVGLLELVAGLWLQSAVLRFATEEYHQCKSMGKTLGAIALFWAVGLLLFSVPQFIWGSSLAQYTGLPQGWLWTAALCAYPFLSVNRVLLPSFLQAAGRSAPYAYYPLVQPITFLALLALHLPFSGLDNGLALGAIVSSLVLSEIIGACVMCIRIRRLVLPVRLDGQMIRSMGHYAFPFIFSTIGAQVVQNIDIIVMKHVGIEEGGLSAYLIAYCICSYLIMVPNMTGIILFPLFLERRMAGRREGIGRYFGELAPQMLFLLSLCIIILIALAGPMLACFSPAFKSAAPTLALLLLGFYFATMIALDSPLFRSHDRVWSVALITLLMASINVALDLWWVPAYGMAGAAMATVVAYITASLLRTIALHISLGFKNYGYFIFALPAAFMAAFSLFEQRFLILFALALLLMVGSVMLVRMTSLFTTSTLQAFQHSKLPAPLYSFLTSCYGWLGKDKN
jgi:O-antigen/teichoic acid export membrane protein